MLTSNCFSCGLPYKSAQQNNHSLHSLSISRILFVAALHSNDPGTFKRWLYGGIQDLGDATVTELMVDWLDAFITETERDWLVAWHLGVSL